ncbi:putative oxidoreductase [Streptococcus loxodontisalivarius]|uniref:Oxidoreductase n=1 Tax=Streptococcus loxodontisalivarius TaxID=1349415 RepID=A0ABS2PQD0_9STRE|nr:putative oxidoreductase [Streptococcus loxodontisalivarius]
MTSVREFSWGTLTTLLTAKINELAEHYQVSSEAIIIAWIMRHPAKMQTIVGTMNPERLLKIAEADKIELSRKDWYAIYTSAGNSLP